MVGYISVKIRNSPVFFKDKTWRGREIFLVCFLIKETSAAVAVVLKFQRRYSAAAEVFSLCLECYPAAADRL